jgi:hypothetical protein
LLAAVFGASVEVSAVVASSPQRVSVDRLQKEDVLCQRRSCVHCKVAGGRVPCPCHVDINAGGVLNVSGRHQPPQRAHGEMHQAPRSGHPPGHPPAIHRCVHTLQGLCCNILGTRAREYFQNVYLLVMHCTDCCIDCTCSLALHWLAWTDASS